MTATEERPQTSPAGGNGHLAAPERPALDVSTAIRTRRTIRRWTDDPVSPEIVKELLECALWAPSACNMQLWDFVVVTDPAIRQSLAEAVPFADKAQVCIFICYNTRFSEGSYANIQSASAAVMNMLLRAHSLGLGGFWQATIHDRQKLRLTLGLPKDVDVLSTTLFGYPAETPGAPARRDPSHLVHWEKYHPKPTLPSSPDPRDWRLDQIADYQQARIRAGPKYNKPIASEYAAVRGYLGHALRRVGADGPKAKVLDLLPCTGLYLEAIAEETEAELHFVELGQQVASFAQARLPRPATSHPYRGTIDLPDASIDAATCVFRLENLPPAERVTLLRETQRVLKPGGALILAHINRGSYFEAMRQARKALGRRDVQYALATDPSLGPFMPLWSGEVDALAAQTGFRKEHAHSVFPLPPEDEARHRVRSFKNAAALLQYQVNGAANGVLDSAIFFQVLKTGAVGISNNYFTGAFPEAFSGGSWGRGIWFNGGGVAVTISGNTFEFTRTGINLDMSGDSAATVVGNTFVTNGTGTSVGVDLDNVSFADNNYQGTNEEFNFSNLTIDIDFDAEVAVATVMPVNPVVDAVVVLGGTGDDTIHGTAGADLLDGNASGTPVADNDTLEGRGGDDLLLGRRGNDVLDGGEGDDRLLGGLGDDQVTGGAGDDSYLYRHGGGADTFHGFVAGVSTEDHVRISGFGAVNTFEQVLSLATQVGPDTVIDFGDGDVLTLADVDKDSLAPEDFRFPQAPNDFNADGRSDILWRHDSGGLASWELDSGAIFHYHPLGGVDNSYQVDAIGDFDGNGTADILWRHDLGFIITWDINHGDQTGYHAIGPTNPADEIVGTGDFNGDGKVELLWRNADTGVVTWQLNTGPFGDTDLNGDEIAFTRDYGPVTSDWTIVGTGDVNGDGNSDIFWRHDSGQLVSWEVDDGAIIGYNDYGHVPTDYEFIETGDFNGDGKSGDIVWRHASGQVVTWELDGGTQIGYHDFEIVTNDYKIEDTGDYNGDGHSDILWRHDSGLPITWELDGGTIIGYHAFDPVDPVWQVQP